MEYLSGYFSNNCPKELSQVMCKAENLKQVIQSFFPFIYLDASFIERVLNWPVSDQVYPYPGWVSINGYILLNYLD